MKIQNLPCHHLHSPPSPKSALDNVFTHWAETTQLRSDAGYCIFLPSSRGADKAPAARTLPKLSVTEMPLKLPSFGPGGHGLLTPSLDTQAISYEVNGNKHSWFIKEIYPLITLCGGGKEGGEEGRNDWFNFNFPQSAQAHLSMFDLHISWVRLVTLRSVPSFSCFFTGMRKYQ